jgi:hypothetical protein
LRVKIKYRLKIYERKWALTNSSPFHIDGRFTISFNSVSPIDSERANKQTVSTIKLGCLCFETD